MIPLVGFLPATDPRMRGTIEAIERELVEGDFVLRYRTADTGEVDGLSGREGAFLACSFWLADCLSLLGREHDARKLLERLLDLRNDLGLLAEEYDPVAGRLVGNFPQAFSHVSLVNSAAKITGHSKPSADHVFLGLARQAMSGVRPAGMSRMHMKPAPATALRALIAESARPIRDRPTSRVAGSTRAGRLAGRSARKATDKPAKEPVTVRKSTTVKQRGAAKAAPVKKAPAKKVAAKRAPTKKVAAKKAPAKKNPATKNPATKNPDKRVAPAKKAVKRAR